MHVQLAEAVDMGLLALQRALARHPRDDHRRRLEHAGDLPADDQWPADRSGAPAR